MQLVGIFLLLAVGPVTSARIRSAVTPVTRVVELLQNLGTKVDQELKEEEDLYETYVCWGKNVVDTKTASNAKAQARVESLTTYIADLEAGRVELTSERSDLTKELAGLNSDIETAEALREKEHEDYLAAKGEMTQAISALNDAVDVLEEGTKQDGALLAVRARLQGRRQEVGLAEEARVAEADALERAVDIGQRFLSSGDARFLARILSGEVPTKDWKKLNRKAEFKMKYKARSTKIQGTLKKLRATFEESLESAEKKEKEAVATHEKLMGSKKEQRSTAEDSLSRLDGEGGAQGMSKEESEAEIDDLKTQISNDEGFIKTTTTDLEKKKEEWKTRKSLRLSEIKAMNEAIAVLHSDDSRDLFKRSMALIQESDYDVSAQRRGAAAAIRAALHVASDRRLVSLAAKVAAASSGNFDVVIKAIDEMIATLNGDGETDLKNKESCEKERAADTKEALTQSEEVDAKTDEIKKLNEEIEKIVEQIVDKKDEIKKSKAELEEAITNRKREHEDWVTADADDAEAIETVDSAKAVLEKFYADNGLSLVQAAHLREPEGLVAGEAPPPPPSTWEEPYGGATKESTGIIGILTLISEDMAKDKAAAKAAEDEAHTAHETFKTETEAAIGALEEAITSLEGTKGEKESAVGEAESAREDTKGLLKAVMERLKAAAPGCDFFIVNFETRSKNRQLEIDGLNKAKEILSK